MMPASGMAKTDRVDRVAFGPIDYDLHPDDRATGRTLDQFLTVREGKHPTEPMT
jgi:hypothetical protein